MSESTPARLCECGCGQPVRNRFRKGHARRGVTVTAATRAKLSEGQRGSKGNNWQGDNVGYSGLHKYLRTHYPKTGICDECGKHAPRTDYALIKGRTYSRNREDYRELCHACHMRYDLGERTFSPEALARISAGSKRRWDAYRERKAAT